MVKNNEVVVSGTLPMKVGTSVVGHLSIGLYRNFARAIKELVSNSWDAGATEVKIKLDPENAGIIVRDNGIGMEIDDLKNRYLAIGTRTQLDETVNELGRKRVGSFGIGSLSVFPYCENLKVITKKRGSQRIIELNFDTKQFFTEDNTFKSIEEIEVPYRSYPSDLHTDVGETITVLNGIRPHIVEELKPNVSKGVSSIDKYTGLEKFKWTLAQYAPIQFPPQRQDLRDFFEDPQTVPMRLWVDGEELFRNTPKEAIVLEQEEKSFGNVVIKYVIMTTMSPIEPEEARGLQVRLRNVAVGLPRDFDVTKYTGKVPGKLNYICGEAHMLSGLDLSLMVDRDSFSYTQEVADVFDFFRKKLVKWNDTLEKWASEDRQIYDSLSSVQGADSIINELRKANVIRFSKERLRLPKKGKLEKRKAEYTPAQNRIVQALSKKKDYKVVPNKAKADLGKPPIEVIPSEKIIMVYEEHPDFKETIEMNNRVFGVAYDTWNPTSTPFSICKLSEKQDVVTFNTGHPLFKSRLSDDIVKKISLGILLMLRGRNDSEELLVKLNHLLEDVFTG